MHRTETITISPCPVCGQEHTYPLTITGSLHRGSEVMKSHSPQDASQRRVTKFLMCPVKRVMFQAVIELPVGFELSA